MALYVVFRVNEKYQARNFGLPGSARGLQVKVEHFRINIFWIRREIWKNIGLPDVKLFKVKLFIAGTSATLTVCVTILICCFAWTTTSTTLSGARSSPRAGNLTDP